MVWMINNFNTPVFYFVVFIFLFFIIAAGYATWAVTDYILNGKREKISINELRNSQISFINQKVENLTNRINNIENAIKQINEKLSNKN